MKKEVTVKEAQPLAIPAGEFDDILNDFHVDASDILIPKILLMQPSSEFVADGVATIGDFRQSVSKEKLGTIVDPFVFVPFHYAKVWEVKDPGDGNKWVRTEEFKPGDETLEWEFTEDGKKLERVKRLNFFGFVPSLVEKGNTLPMVMAFKSTGYREGTKILTQMKLNVESKKLPWSTMYVVSGEKKKNEDNQTYCIPKIEIAGDASADVVRLCYDWYKSMKTKTVKVVVDDSDMKEATRAAEVADTGKF